MEPICSLDSELFFVSICPVRILNISEARGKTSFVKISKCSTLFEGASGLKMRTRMITKKTETLESWTIAIAFNEPQTFEATSSELEIGWNCQRSILLLRSLEFNSKLKGPNKSYFPTFFILNLSKNDLPAPNGIFLFDEHIDNEDANCYDMNFASFPYPYC